MHNYAQRKRMNLIINNGSTSFRFTVYDENKKILSAKIENITFDNAYYKVEIDNQEFKNKCNVKNINDCIVLMNQILSTYSISENIEVIGIRIVSGGNVFNDTTIINNNNIEKIKLLKNFMPLHYNLIAETIHKCKEQYKGTIVGVFDNTFHNSIPKENYLYGLPMELSEKYGIRKYGYHGLSYSSIVSKYSENNDKEKMNSIICHLGGGSSICNIKNGKSYDTTMGFSPNSGLIMSSRCGDIDSSIVFYLNSLGFNNNEINLMLNKKSGYQGIVGFQDAKRIVEESEQGNEKAILLRKVIDINFKKELLSMMAINKPNEIIITGGMGTKNKEQREMLFSNLEDFNIQIDKSRNNLIWDADGIISTDKSLPVCVMVDDEELEMNKECIKVLKR